MSGRANGNQPSVRRGARTRLPTAWGEFVCFGYDEPASGGYHLALVYGDLATVDAPLVRVHSECLTGDVFQSERCDCGQQLENAMRRIVDETVGAVVYLRGHEGRGIGIASKLKAYELQENGRDTVDANLALGLPVDDRDYAPAAAILSDLGVQRVRLTTNNPAKCIALARHGIEISERVAIDPVPTPHNLDYLRAKKLRMGHVFDLPLPDGSLAGAG